MALSESELKDYLLLANTPNLGAVSFLKLLKAFKQPSEILKTPFQQLKPYIDKFNSVEKNWCHESIMTQYVTPAISWQKNNPDCFLLTILDDDYPIELFEVYPPPPLLYLRGTKSLLKSPKIAIVGSRNPTPQGINTAESTARFISSNGFCVVSGMAAGIDGAAHRGSILEKGRTIAVLGTGIDLVYPRSNYDLAHDIAQKGLIISEFALGTKPNSINFPIRNRIIAGLSLATVVVEATIKSGSMITARLALEQGKEVMAFPGSIHNLQSKGPHHLIKQGAKLVETPQEIIEDFSKSDYNKTNDENSNPTKFQGETIKMILEAMGSEITHPDEISNYLNISTEEVHSAFLTLELEGIIQQTSGGRFQRIVF